MYLFLTLDVFRYNLNGNQFCFNGRIQTKQEPSFILYTVLSS